MFGFRNKDQVAVDPVAVDPVSVANVGALEANIASEGVERSSGTHERIIRKLGITVDQQVSKEKLNRAIPAFVGSAEFLASPFALTSSLMKTGYRHETLGQRSILSYVVRREAFALLKEGRDSDIEAFLQSWEAKVDFAKLEDKDLFQLFDDMSQKVRNQSILVPKQPDPNTPRPGHSAFRP